MKGVRTNLVIIALLVVVTVVFSVSSITWFVHRNVSSKLMQKTEEILEGQVSLVSSVLDGMLRSASFGMRVLIDGVLRLDGNWEQTKPFDFANIIPGCRRSWIAFPDGRVLIDSTTNLEYLETHDWWVSYLGGEWQAGGRPLAGQSSAILGRPFMDDLGLNAILPLVVPFHRGYELMATGFIEIDITRVLQEEASDFVIRRGAVELSVEMSILFHDSTLIETTRNIPLKTIRTLGPFSSDYGEGYVEVRVPRSNLGMIFVARVPDGEILQDVRALSFQVMGLGLLGVGILVGLGFALLRMILRLQAAERLALGHQLQALQARINPHFLFNALDGLVGLAREEGAERVLSMVRDLSFLLRYTLRKRQDLVPLSEELEYLEKYVALQRVRYGAHFAFRMDVSSGCLGMLVHRFSIQPVVENSFMHGKADGLSIHLSIGSQAERLLVKVVDTGSGCSPDTLARVRHSLDQETDGARVDDLDIHLGLSTLHRRLRLLYGDSYGIEIDSDGQGFTTRISMPVL